MSSQAAETGLGRRMLEAALALQNEYKRAEALGSLISKLPTSDSLSALVRHLFLLKRERREAVSRTLSIEAFFELPVTQEIVAAIVGHVEEICWEWRWQ